MLQQYRAFAPVRKILRDKRIKGGGVVVMPNVRKLMHYNIVDGGVGILHEIPGKGETVLCTA